MDIIAARGRIKAANRLLGASALTAVLWGLAGTANAIPIIGDPTGIAGPDYVITFNEVATVDTQAITNEFVSYGATFENFGIDQSDAGGAVNGGATGFAGYYLLTGITPYPIDTPYTITFTSTVTDAAFAAADTGDSFSIASYLGGGLVETFDVTIDFVPGSGFMGFANSLFDSIVITPLSSASILGVDTLQFNTFADPQSGVPAPATLALFGLGLIGLGWSRRRS